MEKLIEDFEKINVENLHFQKYQKYQKCKINGLSEIIPLITYELNKIIPWTDYEYGKKYGKKFGFVWSGGLLYSAIVGKMDNLQLLSDIDLFFYGNNKYKIQILTQIMNNLANAKYKYLVGFNKSVVYIFIQGIPRIIQLIFTSKSCPEEIIDSFDLTHLQSFWDGHNLYSNPITIKQFNNNLTLINPTRYKVKPSRLIKYLKRGLDVNELLYSDYNFILDKSEFFNLSKCKRQNELYTQTNNLTTIDDINKTNFESDFIDFLTSAFWCKILTLDKLKFLIDNNYYLIDNKMEIKEKISNDCKLEDLFGDLEDYLKLDLAGKFDNEIKLFDLDLEDDVIKVLSISVCHHLEYETQKYVYIPCKVINMHNETYTIDFSITELKVIDYLLGLTDDIFDDLTNYKNTNEKNLNNLNHFNNDRRFKFPFYNSLTFPKIKSKYNNKNSYSKNSDDEDSDNEDSDNKNLLKKIPNEYMTNGIINEYGLVWKICSINDFSKYKIKSKYNILCKISLYYQKSLMYGFKLVPISFDEIS